MKRLIVFVLLALCLADCASRRDARKIDNAGNKTGNTREVTAAESGEGNGGIASATRVTKKPVSEDAAERAECLKTDVGDKAVLAKQTFPIDFEPFRKSCFVTVYNPEYEEPPMESEFAIYTDGKEVFKFPSQFNGVTFGCRVEAVAFQDLNSDGLTDVIMAGICQAKSASYSENMIYVNTGNTFVTDENANYKLQNLKRIRDISDYVKDNPGEFFK